MLNRIYTVIALSAVAFLLIFLTYLVYVRPIQTARVAYAQDWTARMLIVYMSENNLQWPDDWSDLQSAHASVSHELGGISSLEDIANVVAVDFAFKPTSVATGNDLKVDKTVIRPKSGSSYFWEEPNTMIFSWIRKHSASSKQESGEESSADNGLN